VYAAWCFRCCWPAFSLLADGSTLEMTCSAGHCAPNAEYERCQDFRAGESGPMQISRIGACKVSKSHDPLRRQMLGVTWPARKHARSGSVSPNAAASPHAPV
jgi:hypothetical protein